jgi:hypothetical protein
MQPRSSANILATAKVKYTRKKPTESTYRGQILSFSPPNPSTANNSESRSSVTTTKPNDKDPNDNHLGLEHEYAQEFTFRFEPFLEGIYLAEAMQQDSSIRPGEHISTASDTTLACFVFRTHLHPKYISF